MEVAKRRWPDLEPVCFRYIAVCHHTVARRVCTLRHARIAAACIVASAVVVCLPTYLMYQPRQLLSSSTATAEPSAANNRSLGAGLAVGYGVRVPQNLSVVFVDKETDGAAGYWFEEKSSVGPTFQTVNFWVSDRVPTAGFPTRCRTETETESD